MFIDLFKNNGVPYLRLVESRRKTTKNGKLTSVKVPIFNIGPLSKFDDGNPDYVKRLRQSFKDGTPIPTLPLHMRKESSILLIN